MFKFIHAADLHLDTQFIGLKKKNESIGEKLLNATFQAFDSLIELCISENVDFLVISGDVFNSSERSLRAQIKFLEGLEELSRHNIKIFVAHGNHDPIKGWARQIRWPDSVHIFPGDKVQTFEFKKENRLTAILTGMSYYNSFEERNLSKFFVLEPEEKNSMAFKIAVLHCNIGSNSDHLNYAPCSIGDLTDKYYNYWALGHIHKHQILNKSPYIVYPGCTQGCSIRETGDRGCCIVEVNSTEVTSLEFRPLNPVLWEYLDISINNIETIDQLIYSAQKKIMKSLEMAKGRPMVARVKISGYGKLFDYLSDPDKLEDFQKHLAEKFEGKEQFYCIEKMVFQASPEINLEEAINRNDIIGHILRTSRAIKENGHINQVKDWIKQLYKNKKVKSLIDQPSDEDLRSLYDEAEKLCIHLLEN